MTKCRHIWVEIEDDTEFHIGDGGELLYKNVICELCGKKGKEAWSWLGTYEEDEEIPGVYEDEDYD